MRYGAYLDHDSLPLGFVQADKPYISVTTLTVRGNVCLAWTEHGTATAAQSRAKRDKALAFRFNGIAGCWDATTGRIG